MALSHQAHLGRTGAPLTHGPNRRAGPPGVRPLKTIRPPPPTPKKAERAPVGRGRRYARSHPRRGRPDLCPPNLPLAHAATDPRTEEKACGPGTWQPDNLDGATGHWASPRGTLNDGGWGVDEVHTPFRCPAFQPPSRVDGVGCSCKWSSDAAEAKRKGGWKALPQPRTASWSSITSRRGRACKFACMGCPLTCGGVGSGQELQLAQASSGDAGSRGELPCSGVTYLGHEALSLWPGLDPPRRWPKASTFDSCACKENSTC